MPQINGKAYVLGDDIDTDQIIPAKYLMYNPSDAKERPLFGRFAMDGVPAAGAGLPDGKIPFVDHSDQNNNKSEFKIIIAGKNFGCGSSREHAPLALAVAGIGAVVAEFYARIFFRNSVNGGYLIPYESEQRLIDQINTGDIVEIDTAEKTLVNRQSGQAFPLKPLGDVAQIIRAGGMFNYAKSVGMLAK